jgi:peptidoglycan-associated lipoprotein
MKTTAIGGLLVLVLMAAGCSRNAPPEGEFGTGTGAGYSGGADGGFGAGGVGDGFSSGSLSGGTLPGTSISDRVFFAVDQSTLSGESMAVLDAQIGWLLQNPQYPILIEGHADERGTREYNLALGARRASAVRNYMVGRGVPDPRISTITYGRERPVATCASDSCWSQNRRAVTVVTGGPGV